MPLGECFSRPDSVESLALQSQEHSRSLEVDLAVGGGQTAQTADLLQGTEKWVVVGQAFADVVACRIMSLRVRLANQVARFIHRLEPG